MIRVVCSINWMVVNAQNSGCQGVKEISAFPSVLLIPGQIRGSGSEDGIVAL